MVTRAEKGPDPIGGPQIPGPDGQPVPTPPTAPLRSRYAARSPRI